MNRLILFLHPFPQQSLSSIIPKGRMAVWPFYTTVSRLNHKPDSFNCKLMAEPISKIVALPNHNLTYADVMNRRALELLALEGNIYIMWSGGIDSTGVVTAILKTWPKEELKRVIIICDTNSIRENKNFFPHIVKNFKIEQVSHRIEEFAKKGYVITGELGDQIFGSDIIGECVKHWGDQVINQSWKDIAPKMFEIFSPERGKETFENYAHIAEEQPFELQTVHDFFWWLNFTQKWQHVMFRILMTSSWTDPKQYFPKVIHFYQSEEFQVWSLYNQDKKIKGTWASYKYTAKEYIIDYSKDEGAINQLKIPSLQNLYVGIDYNWAIDEDWNILCKEDALARIIK